MASQWTFGRIGVSASAGGDGLDLSGHYVMDFAGDELGIEADLDASTVADQKALREQFRGYDLNEDELTVAVTSTQDPTVNGWYTAQSIEVADTVGTHFTGGIGSHATIDLLRSPGFQSPLVELICGGSLLANSHSVAIGSTIPTVGAPVGAYCMTPGFETATTLTGADGAVNVFYDATTPTTYAVYPSWMVAAADAYKGAARLEVSYDSGVSWRTVVGREMPNLPTMWRVSNSLVRVTATTTASKLELSVEHHDGTQWETAKVWQVTGDTSYTALAVAPAAVTPMKNAPDEVRVQVAAGGTAHVTLDVRVRRGSRMVECYLVHPTLTTLGVRRGTDEAATALTTACGLRATNTDAGGNRYVVATPLALAGSSTTIGAIRVTSTAFPFALGAAIGGTVGTGFAETMGLASGYLAGVVHTEGVVAV
jgi:hypothetical protein